MDAQPCQPKKKRCKTLEERNGREREKHSMKEPCTNCPRNCIDKIGQRRRIALYIQYWNVTYNERKNYLHQTVERHDANHKTFSNRKRGVSDCKNYYLFVIGAIVEIIPTV